MVNNFNITTKVSHIITDNASNMPKAFCLPGYIPVPAESDTDSDADCDSHSQLKPGGE